MLRIVPSKMRSVYTHPGGHSIPSHLYILSIILVAVRVADLDNSVRISRYDSDTPILSDLESRESTREAIQPILNRDSGTLLLELFRFKIHYSFIVKLWNLCCLKVGIREESTPESCHRIVYSDCHL